MPVAAPDSSVLLAQPTRARLFAALAELREPATTADLAAKLGLHPNGARRHLERLSDGGLVERDRARGNPGRPRDLWRVSADAPEPPSIAKEPYAELARWLAGAIPSRPGSAEEIRQAGHRIGLELAPEDASDPAAAFTGVLRRLGFRPEVEDSGERRVCRLGRCPYAHSASENPEIICTLHRGISEGLLERLEPDARVTRFEAFDSSAGGCQIEIEGLKTERLENK